jgi:hypothetical protein
MTRPGEPIIDIFENVGLTTGAADYAWTNTRQIWATGTANMATGKVHVEAFMQQRTTDFGLMRRPPVRRPLSRFAGGRTSALGQKQTFGLFIAMSALPPKADIAQHSDNVRFGP